MMHLSWGMSSSSRLISMMASVLLNAADLPALE
jgi:hypothetical protein